jgi:hypothetical protein
MQYVETKSSPVLDFNPDAARGVAAASLRDLKTRAFMLLTNPDSDDGLPSDWKSGLTGVMRGFMGKSVENQSYRELMGVLHEVDVMFVRKCKDDAGAWQDASAEKWHDDFESHALRYGFEQLRINPSPLPIHQQTLNEFKSSVIVLPVFRNEKNEPPDQYLTFECDVMDDALREFQQSSRNLLQEDSIVIYGNLSEDSDIKINTDMIGYASLREQGLLRLQPSADVVYFAAHEMGIKHIVLTVDMLMQPDDLLDRVWKMECENAESIKGNITNRILMSEKASDVDQTMEM